MSETAAKYAFPRPRQGGPGSTELEQSLLAAHLVACAKEAASCKSSRKPATTSEGGADEFCSDDLVDEVVGDDAVDEVIDDGAPNGNDATSGGANESPEPNSLAALSRAVEDGVGARWRTDWPQEDRRAFRKGVYAFRRHFHSIRATYLPHRAHGDIVEYFYT